MLLSFNLSPSAETPCLW